MTSWQNAVRAARNIVLAAALAAAAACGGGDDGYGGAPPPAAPSALTYTSPVTTVVGVAMTPLAPAVTGTVTAWTVAPALPGGIAINAGTGVISGTPAATAAQAVYTITATNATGSTTFALSLKVDPPPPSAYTMSALVSDGTVPAVSNDPKLKNPWGLAALPGGPMWVSNNATRSSTVYDGTGLIQPVLVNIPAGTNGPGDVTGIVASNSPADFTVTNGTTTAPARFLFATESGTISGWAPTVDAGNAKIAYDDGVGAANFKGLAIAANGAATFLYAADFHNNRIVVFDRLFAKVVPTGGFTDAQLPAGYAPFNIQAVQIGTTTVLVVAYAKQNGAATEDVPGAGLGLVNTFDVNGTLLKRLIPVGGALNAPWGIAVAPANFGTLSGALLIGNFGDGKINGYNATTGALIHTLADATGNAIVNSGLWGLSFGNGGRNQPTNVLYLAAGLNGELNGLYARIDLGATAPDIVAPTGVAITAPAAAAAVSGAVTVTANAADNVAVAKVVFSVRVGVTITEIATDTTAPYSVSWNTGAVANGTATLTAAAFDAFGNSTTSPAIAVTVNNVPDVTVPAVFVTSPPSGNVTGTVAVTAQATDNVGVAQVEFFAGATSIGVDTTEPYSVQWNTATFAGVQQLTAVARDGAGNTTTSTAVPVTVVVAPTLAQLQTDIFGPRCSGCHTGGGAQLPGSMNLSSAAATFAALVNVTSVEAPTLKRVLPGDPNNSYVIHKLEGAGTIVQSRMPLGGPFLDQPTIDQVRAWIQAGAAP